MSAVAAAPPVDLGLYERFNAAERAVAAAHGPFKIEAMADACRDVAWRMECSSRAAAAAGGEFDGRIIRHILMLRSTATFLDLVASHADEIRPIVQPGAQQRRRRA